MAFLDFLGLTWGKKPVVLYQVTRGSETAFYTTRKGGYETPAGVPSDAFAGETQWVESSLVPGSRTISSRKERTELKLTFPATDVFVRGFTGVTQPIRSSVQIWEGDENDPDAEFAARFLGRVIEAVPERAFTVLKCGPGRRGSGMVPVLQPLCPHVVYFGKCGVDRELHYGDWTATAASGRTVTVTSLEGLPDGDLAFGLLRYAGREYTIAGNSGTDLRLLMDPEGLEADITENGSAAIEIATGCDRTVPTCNVKFANDDNHGGAPEMGESPYDGRSLL